MNSTCNFVSFCKATSEKNVSFNIDLHVSFRLTYMFLPHFGTHRMSGGIQQNVLCL